jgi:hypothetical protein
MEDGQALRRLLALDAVANQICGAIAAKIASPSIFRV